MTEKLPDEQVTEKKAEEVAKEPSEAYKQFLRDLEAGKFDKKPDWMDGDGSVISY